MSKQGTLTIVHKHGEEGGLLIDASNGIIKQPLMERPEWAAGLVVALTADRLNFYANRLGLPLPATITTPDTIAFEDLGWLSVDEDGEHIELEADAEFRMEAIAKYLGVDRDTGDLGKALAEHEADIYQHRTPEEVAALEEAQSTGMPKVAEA